MTVREFNGTSDRLVTDVGAASGMTYGTWAAIVKFSDLSDFRGIAYAHDSGGSYKGAFGTTNFSRFSLNDGSNDTNLGAATLSTGVWYLCVARKAAGAGVIPRFSVYNFSTGAWIHGDGTVALNDFVAPGAGGTHQFAYQGGSASIFAGRVASRAMWSNSLPWSSDSSGDTAIETAGLHRSAYNWNQNNPTVFQLFNQSSVATAVADLSSAGTANQTSIVGTTAVSGDDPTGFTFSLTQPQPILSYNFDEASGAVVDDSGNGYGFSISGSTVRTASGGGHTGKGLTQTANATQAGPALTSALQTTSRTWMAWLKFAAAVNGWILEFHNNANNTGVWGLLDISGTLRFRAKDSSNTVYESTGIARDFGNWQHFAATHDGAKIRFYLNGVLYSTTTMATSIWTADLLNILDQTGTNVVMDDVRFYDQALSAASIASLMGTPVPTPSASGPNIYFANGAEASGIYEMTTGGVLVQRNNLITIK